MVFEFSEFSEAWATQNALKSQNISNHNAHTILMLMIIQPALANTSSLLCASFLDAFFDVAR